MKKPSGAEASRGFSIPISLTYGRGLAVRGSDDPPVDVDVEPPDLLDPPSEVLPRGAPLLPPDGRV